MCCGSWCSCPFVAGGEGRSSSAVSERRRLEVQGEQRRWIWQRAARIRQGRLLPAPPSEWGSTCTFSELVLFEDASVLPLAVLRFG
mmetsp:Transcript_29589/g.96708  ORF Transcript_29589/g.96708 Transcript_29589/m.96708 type:complete len:86 (+) Transcript_29589:654-911(+)